MGTCGRSHQRNQHGDDAGQQTNDESGRNGMSTHGLHCAQGRKVGASCKGFPVALHLHRAERTDLLAEGLGELLARPLPDPFAEEVVVVPERGVERWLGQRLSHRLGIGPRGGDGVCAGIRFIKPYSLVATLLEREYDDPWHPDRLVWPLLEAIDEALDEPWAQTLATHLGHGLSGEEAQLRANRRWSVARRLAGLFAGHAVQRPQLLTDWREGRDTDGCGEALDEDLRWQPELWRRVLDRVDVVPPDVRMAETVERLRTGGDGLTLPDRLSLFGHTRLPRNEVLLLGALAQLRDVHLWLPQPSAQLWDDLAETAAEGPVARAADRSVEAVAHPLLASLGRDARELRRTLAGAGPLNDQLISRVAATTTLLGRLQGDIRANRAPVPGPVAGDDNSLQVHACHGPARQVEVLREVLVGLLADDPTLEPRDVLVMCPDIETYAPLIQAGFGLGEVAGGTHPAHSLRMRLADRSLASTNPLLAVAARLIELAGGRVTSTEVLDLLATPVVAGRFALDTDDLTRVARWIEEAGIRWGLDAGGRAAYRLERFGQNTWRAGLDRVLLGVAMSEDGQGRLGAALPVDDVSSNDIDLVGRLAEYVDRIDAALTSLQTARTAGQWARAVSTAVGSLTRTLPKDAWQTAQFDKEMAGIGDADSADGVVLALTDVRALLQHRLAGRPTRANFRTGTLTVCTMVPMRSVPHRVVCLVGLDDGDFPRVGAVDGDDVLARSPMTGERDARSEDRQLLLDAVLAATDKLVITYSGANEHSGAERPPAVPLGELIDAAKQTAPEATFVVRHPLQAFDARNLTPGLVPGPERPFSFDRAALAGAEAARGMREPRPAFLPGPLPAVVEQEVSLVDLQRFLVNPAKEFLRSRLEVGTPLTVDSRDDAIPIELDPLGVWGVGDRLLRDVLAGQDPVASMTAEQLRGLLPPGGLGGLTLTEVVRDVQALVERTAVLRSSEPRAVDIDVDLGSGRRLTGTVTGVVGHQRLAITFSKIRARQRLDNWVDLLALSASHPDQHWTAMVVGRGKGAPARSLVGPVDHRAVDWLRELVELRDRGLREPLPLPLKTGLSWAEAKQRELRGDPRPPIESADRDWTTDRFKPDPIPGEQDDPAHVLVYGEAAPLDVLLGPVRHDEPCADGAEHRLDQLTRLVWGPLIGGSEMVGPL